MGEDRRECGWNAKPAALRGWRRDENVTHVMRADLFGVSRNREVPKGNLHRPLQFWLKTQQMY